MKGFIKEGILISIGMLISAGLWAQMSSPADTFPVPKQDPNMLFYLQRQPNTNTIIVQLNVMPNGQVNTDDPVNVFWRRFQEDGQKEKLNFVQKEFAYGVHVKKVGDGLYDLNFVSYKKMKFRLERDKGNVWRVYSTLKNGDKVILRRIYLHVHGGTFWKPHVDYVELKGAQPSTLSEVRERFGIKDE